MEENVKRFKELSLCHGFLFGEVMQDEETCKTVLEIVLGRKVYRIHNANKEKHVDVDGFHKGVRLDVYFEDDKETAYSVEMENKNRYNLPKRSRHYQSVIDIKLLPTGEVDYSRLNDGVIIFICTFDLFGRGRYCYTFENRCIQELDLRLKDGTMKIFLNTEGDNEEETRPELIEFLRYVKDSIHVKPQTEQVKRISERVDKVKKDSMSEARYMMSLVHDNEMRYEGRLEGLAEGKAEGKAEGEKIKLIKQTLKKMDKGMSVEEIAEMFEEEPVEIEKIVRAVQNTKSRNPEEIYSVLVDSVDKM